MSLILDSAAVKFSVEVVKLEEVHSNLFWVAPNVDLPVFISSKALSTFATNFVALSLPSISIAFEFVAIVDKVFLNQLSLYF